MTSWFERQAGMPPWWRSPYRPWDFILRLRVRPTTAAFEMLGGFLLAALAMSLVFAAHLLTGLLQIQGVRPVWLLDPGSIAWMLKGALLEELIYRGLLLPALLHRWCRPGWAIGISALLFGLAHATNPHATPLSVFSNALGGVMYAVPFVLTGRLYFPVALHFGWNWVQGVVYGFPMSGMALGSVLKITVAGPAWVTGAGYGPEGGVIGIGARLAIIAASIWLLRGRGRAADLALRADASD
jgi:uncharacterized protein